MEKFSITVRDDAHRAQALADIRVLAEQHAPVDPPGDLLACEAYVMEWHGRKYRVSRQYDALEGQVLTRFDTWVESSHTFPHQAA